MDARKVTFSETAGHKRSELGYSDTKRHVDMKNLFDATVANQIKARLGKLEPQSERRWGKMTAAQMLAHCSVSMQWAVGEEVPEKGA